MLVATNFQLINENNEDFTSVDCVDELKRVLDSIPEAKINYSCSRLDGPC